MSVRIRLRRMGRKKQPHYRVVVADGAAARDGRIVENLGYYRPQSSPARLVLDLERVNYWLGMGAEASNTVQSLVRKARRGGDRKIALGEPDLEAQRKYESEALAERRAAERKRREAAQAATEPEDAGAEPAATATVEATEETVEAGADAAAAQSEPAPAKPAGQARRGGKAKEPEAES